MTSTTCRHTYNIKHAHKNISVVAESDVRSLRGHLLPSAGETQATTVAREQRPLSAGPAAVG